MVIQIILKSFSSSLDWLLLGIDGVAVVVIVVASVLPLLSLLLLLLLLLSLLLPVVVAVGTGDVTVADEGDVADATKIK